MERLLEQAAAKHGAAVDAAERGLLGFLCLISPTCPTRIAQWQRLFAHSRGSIMSRRILPFLVALLGAGSMTTLQAAEPAALQHETGVQAPHAMFEKPDVDTGTAGTTSGITGADMDQEDETTGGGQSQGDAMFQTPASQSDAGAAYETETPEREEALLPDEPLGADDSGRREDGEPQASTSDSPE